MEPMRNTGLGNSLLLRRTEAPPAIKSVAVEDVQIPEVLSEPQLADSVLREPESEPVPESKLPKSTSKKFPKVPLVLRDRCTLHIEREVNEQLHLVARIEGRERSEIVSTILRKHLPKYHVERE